MWLSACSLSSCCLPSSCRWLTPCRCSANVTSAATPTAGSDAPRYSYYREGGCGRRRHTNGTAVVGVGRGLLPSWSSSSWSLWIASMDWKWGDLTIPSLEMACRARSRGGGARWPITAPEETTVSSTMCGRGGRPRPWRRVAAHQSWGQPKP